jgi:hypothetical protein
MATHRRRAGTSARRREGPGDLDVDVEVGQEIKAVADQLRAVDKKLPTKFRTQMRKTAATAVKRVKTEARGLPSAGSRGGGITPPHKPRQLRRAVAKGVRAQASAGGRRGAGLRIVTSMPLPSQAMLPRGLDTPGGWRHPFFGDREDWVDQPGHSWFREPIAKEHPATKKAVLDLLAQARDQIASAGASETT